MSNNDNTDHSHIQIDTDDEPDEPLDGAGLDTEDDDNDCVEIGVVCQCAACLEMKEQEPIMPSFVLPPHLKSDDDPRATKNIPSAKRGGQKLETATHIRRRLKGKQQAQPMDTTQPKQAKGEGETKEGSDRGNHAQPEGTEDGQVQARHPEGTEDGQFQASHPEKHRGRQHRGRQHRARRRGRQHRGPRHDRPALHDHKADDEQEKDW